ncbi:MAG: orotate phosphoribosyltransferase [Bacteroidia bacterium]
MATKTDSSCKIAEFLLQIKAVKLQPQTPFTWASGWKSPIYCDNRVILSHPIIRTHIRKEFEKLIEDKFGRPDVIAGVATGAIAHGALVAEIMGLPFVYVRSEAKNHGMTNLIEGQLHEGQSVVVIEDLISTGGSSLKAVQALRDAKCVVKGMAAIFSYGFDHATQAFKDNNCIVHTLTDYETLIEEAARLQYITPDMLDTLAQWRANPAEWSGN